MKRRVCILGWLLIIATMGRAQWFDSIVDNAIRPGYDRIPVIPHSQLLSGGYFDVMQSGQVNAAARFFKLYIGEPGGFRVPVSVYTGVSANHFSGTIASDNDKALPLINPGAGILNVHVDGSNKVAVGRGVTSLQANYQLGLRWLNQYSVASGGNITFFNLITGAGLTFITGAWQASGENSPGFFWLNARGLYAYSPLSALKMFFPLPMRHHLLGCSGGMGIELSEMLQVKVFYFYFLNNRQTDAFRKSFLQLSVNYSSK